MAKRRRIIEYRIKDYKAAGVKKGDLDGDILETNDNALVAKLRRLGDSAAMELSRERAS